MSKTADKLVFFLVRFASRSVIPLFSSSWSVFPPYRLVFHCGMLHSANCTANGTDSTARKVHTELGWVAAFSLAM